MNSICKYSPEKGREMGLITIYTLHSLKENPKSGYDLLKEITEKTGGLWAPSKGTLYPILKSLEEDGLIRVMETGKRSKNIYELTDDGEKTLQHICSIKQESRERLEIFKQLLIEIFGEERISLKSQLIEIKYIFDGLSHEKRVKATAIIEESIKELRRLESDDCDTGK